MFQVLFRIPIYWPFPDGIPIYGYGMMLFLAFILCTQFLIWRGKRDGIDKERIYDAAFWVFICGILGARVVFMIQYKVPWYDCYKFWEGGLVFYGSAIGGAIGFALYRAYMLVRHRYRIPTWQLADIVAPTVCIGLALGRVGCLLNGCCYGHVCQDCGIHFPTLPAPARGLVVDKYGYQTTAGFSIDERSNFPGVEMQPRVGAVEPGSPAARAGLQAGDLIVSAQAGDRPVQKTDRLSHLHAILHPENWPRGESSLTLTVARGGAQLTLPPFTPRTIGLHPTQIYETFSMILLFFFLVALLPYRLHYGMLFPILMVCYAGHRFLNESLRDDTAPVLANLTLSQVISILVFVGGIALEVFLYCFAPRIGDTPAPPAQAKA